MPLWTPPSSYQTFERGGPTCTASATPHTKGAYAEIIAATAKDSYGMWIYGADTFSAGAATSMLMDIAVGAAASEVVIAANLNMSGCERGAGGGSKTVFFPLFIPEGARVSARIQALIVSDTINLQFFFMEMPLFGMDQSFHTCTTYGANTATSLGTAVTAGNSGAEGSWTQIAAATSRDHKAWTILPGLNADLTSSAHPYFWDIGAGAAASEKALVENWLAWEGSSEVSSGPQPPVPIYAPLASGERLVCRGSDVSGTAEAHDIIVYAFD